MPESRDGRIEGWDLIRGFGMFAVLLTHGLEGAGFRTPVHGAGIVGLTAFFVLSGYLITGILARDIARFGQVRFVTFYWNRVVRLLPALVVVLVLYAILETLLDTRPDPVWASLLIGLLYLANMPVLRELTGGLRQMWSLSFEEQFYFVWPTVLTLALRYRKAVSFTLAAIIMSTVMMIGSVLVSWSNPGRVYTLQTTWAPVVLIGCLGYLARDRVRQFLRPGTRAGAPGLALSVLVCVGAVVTFDHQRHLMYLGGTTVLGLATLVLVIWSEDWRSVRHPLLRPFFGLGVVSYAAYLYNYPITVFLHGRIEDGGLYIVVTMTLSVVCAIASWFLVEKPAQRRWRGMFTSKVETPRAAVGPDR